ncbi:MAG: F0F1 ATP synthase subunit delta [Candidatus Paceibacterota bacterium]|jgi:F0F1-type ATP synthase delta subunit
MKYQPEVYAQVLIEGLKSKNNSEENSFIKKFANSIKKNGDLPKIKKIIEAIERRIVKKDGGRVIEIEFARTVSETALAKLTGQFTKKDIIKTKINEQLVAGVRITIDGEQELDNSLQKKLAKIFK